VGQSASEQIQFSISVESAPGGHTIKVAGELDMATAPELQDAVEMVKASDEMVEGSNLLLDLSEVSFIDSTGIKAVLIATRVAADHGVAIEVRCSPIVKGTLAICGLDGQIAGSDGVPPTALSDGVPTALSDGVGLDGQIAGSDGVPPTTPLDGGR